MPREIVPDVDDPRLALAFVDLQVDGRFVRALLDSGAARSCVVERPDLVSLEAPAEGAEARSPEGRRAQKRQVLLMPVQKPTPVPGRDSDR